MRLLVSIVALCALAGCNLSDPLEEFNSNQNNDNNNNNNINNNPNANIGDDGNNVDNDMGGGDIDVQFANVMAGGSGLPAQIASQSGRFTVTADVTPTNSPDCAGCAVQVVIALSDGSSANCLIDEPPTGSAIAAMTDLESSDTEGTLELLWGAFELSNCDEALTAATSLGASLGEIEFVEAGPLQVVQFTPGDMEAEVVVTSPIRIAFNASIDQASALGKATLTGPMGVVPTTLAVEDDEIVLTPQNPLAEFQTLYTVNVSAGVTGGGRTLEADVSSTFTTRMFVPDTFYAASNEYHGIGFSLAIDNANRCVMQPTDQTAPQQRFRFVPRDGGWIAYNSRAIAAARALDGGDGTINCAMVSLGANPAPSSIWQFTNQAAGMVSMGNQRFGTAQYLDATANPPGTGADAPCTGSVACPLMQPAMPMNDQQRWQWRRVQ